MHFRMVLHSGKRNEIKSFAEVYNERATRLYSPWRVILQYLFRNPQVHNPEAARESRALSRLRECSPGFLRCLP